MGPDGALSDRELTDNEGPPTSVPIMKSSSTRSLVRKLDSIDQDLASKDEDEVGEEEEEARKGDIEASQARDRGVETGHEQHNTEESAFENEVDINSAVFKQSPATPPDKNENKTKEDPVLTPHSTSTFTSMDANEAPSERHVATVTAVDEFPSTTAKVRGIASPETSSESSDAESIVMVEKPSFTFMTCAAVHEIPPLLTVKEIRYRPSPYVAELIDKCEPALPANSISDPRCCVMDGESNEPWLDELLYDDTELDWTKDDEEEDIFACDIDGCLEVNFNEKESEVLFPELESGSESMRNGQESVSSPTEQQTCNPDSDESPLDSDGDMPSSPAMTTPLKTYYRLVPSPHSSPTDEEVEELQVTRPHDGNSKCLSPIPECPSVDEDLDEWTESVGHDRCDYNIISIEVDDVRSCSPEDSAPMAGSKGELRSLLRTFVAEQLRECEGSGFKPRFSQSSLRPEPRRPLPRPHRFKPLSNLETADNDVLLPPLTPQQRVSSDSAKVVSSPKLRNRDEWETGSDIVSCRRDMSEGDESSDGSLTTKTEPWCTPRRGAFRPAHYSTAAPTLSSVSVSKVTASVTFLGCVDENNNATESENTDANSRSSSTSEEIQTKAKSAACTVVLDNNTRRNSTTSRTSTSSFVKLTYCGSELSDAEFDTHDKPVSKDPPSPTPKVSAIVQRPKIECIPIVPCTPYAPQEEFKKRYNERDQPARIIYRFSGEFTATVPSKPSDTKNKRQYRVSGEYIATITTCAPIRSLTSLTMTSSSTMDSGKPESMESVESTEVVWIANKSLMSKSEVPEVRDSSVPSTPTSLRPRGGRTFSKFRLFRLVTLQM